MITYSDELYHHGIKGQKWGVRRYQNADGSLTEKGLKRYGSKEVFNAYREKKKAGKELHRSVVEERYWNKYNPKGKADYRKRQMELADKSYKADVAYKKAKDRQRKSAVKEYQKLYDKSVSEEDKSDELFKSAEQQYKALGKTLIGRSRAVSKAQKGKGSEAANKYLKTWDEANKLGDQSYDTWQKAREAYKLTGRNYLARVINNAKYGG